MLLVGLFVVALASPCFTQYQDELFQISEIDKSADRRQQPGLLLLRNLEDDDNDNELREDSKEPAWMPLPLQVREKRSPWKGGRGGGACCGGGGRPWGGKPGGGGGWGGGGGGGGAWATSSAGSWGGGYGGGKGYGRGKRK